MVTLLNCSTLCYYFLVSLSAPLEVIATARKSLFVKNEISVTVPAFDCTAFNLCSASGRRRMPSFASCALHDRFSLSIHSSQWNSPKLLPKTGSHYPSLLQMSKSSNDFLRQQILKGAAMKLKSDNDILSAMSTSQKSEKIQIPAAESDQRNVNQQEMEFSYFVREGLRSDIDDITNVLMDAFHPESRPTFDSYIRRYKYNHLKMCFDAIEERDRGLFVACAVPKSSAPVGVSTNNTTLSSNPIEKEQIVGFCSVDGRTPDPSCKIEFLTPSTLASASPRPYLSDLGVSPTHRRRGIGEMLVRSCEEWTLQRGYNTLYLKVDDKNKGGMALYLGLGYKKTDLPCIVGGRKESSACAVENNWDSTVLLERSLVAKSSHLRKKRKREWLMRKSHIVRRLWKRDSSLIENDNPPPL